MTGRDLLKELMAERRVTNAQLAERVGIPQTTMWARLNSSAEGDMQLCTFCEMVNALDYELVIRPKGKEYVGGSERVVFVRMAQTAKKRGRPRKHAADRDAE